MKNIFRNLIETLAEAALLEDGLRPETNPITPCDPSDETLEENLMEVAFAEEADYDDIHTAILNEHLRLCSAA